MGGFARSTFVTLSLNYATVYNFACARVVLFYCLSICVGKENCEFNYRFEWIVFTDVGEGK